MNAPNQPEDMDSSLLQLERELQSLTPTSPPRQTVRDLTARMESVSKNMVTTGSPVSRLAAFPWRRLAVPAAAAAAVALSVQSGRSIVPQQIVAENGITPGQDTSINIPSKIKWTPLPKKREYVGFDDLGLSNADEASLLHYYRLQVMEHREWMNEAERSVIRWTVPNQQSAAVPVSFH